MYSLEELKKVSDTDNESKKAYENAVSEVESQLNEIIKEILPMNIKANCRRFLDSKEADELIKNADSNNKIALPMNDSKIDLLATYLEVFPVSSFFEMYLIEFLKENWIDNFNDVEVSYYFNSDFPMWCVNKMSDQLSNIDVYRFSNAQGWHFYANGDIVR